MMIQPLVPGRMTKAWASLLPHHSMRMDEMKKPSMLDRPTDDAVKRKYFVRFMIDSGSYKPGVFK